MPVVIFYFVYIYPNIIATDTPAIINKTAIVIIHPNGDLPFCPFISNLPFSHNDDNFTQYYFICFTKNVNIFQQFVM